MKIIPLSLFFAGITLFSCSNESTNNLSTNSQKVKLNKNEVLSIAYDDAKELTDKDIFNMVSSFANMNNNGVSRSTSASFKITKRVIKELQIQRGFGMGMFLEVPNYLNNHEAVLTWVKEQLHQIKD